ncbi:YeeE/YedE family protein [Otariodibacter sp.]|uniref:YeeE/YedE family protein n=1 Tax=Otariodibacter sp. TaxID=3030919 RepID=UPI0026387347|nr:YeeE/YedE family protein [Otariodibacter sp.]
MSTITQEVNAVTAVSNQPILATTSQKNLVAAGIAVELVLLVYLLATQNLSQSLLLIIGFALGLTLFHARFGFTSAFQRMAAVGNGQALRAHMLMLAVAVTLFAPILSYGISFFGGSVAGHVSPISTSLIVGAFLFGVGMQIGGGCASGTLYTVGSGRTVMFITLIFFIVGSTVGAYHLPFWLEEMPSLGAYSLATSTGFGYGGAWLISIVLFGLIAWVTLVIEKKKKAPKVEPIPSAKGWKRILRGSWPLFVAAIILAVLNALTLMTRGAPWGVTSGFALWGSKLALLSGFDVTSWGYWQGNRAATLQQSIFADSTSVLNFGIIIGAFVASAAAGLFKITKITSRRTWGSIIGGFLMGYGARLAFGCNIGAYFGGIASFSLHGYVWGLLAMVGTFVALYLRPYFGLSVPKPTDSFC